MTTTRDATVADRDAVVTIWEACGLTRPWNDPDADFRRALGHEASTVIVAEQGARIVATTMTASTDTADGSIIWASRRTIRDWALRDNCSTPHANGSGFAAALRSS